MLDKLKFIAFAGRMYAGKTSIAKALADKLGSDRAVVMSFATPIKKMLLTMGLTEDQVYGSLKGVPDYKILGGKTPRHAMQTLGTEWGREMINPNIWANILMLESEKVKGKIVIVDDLRFEKSELSAIESKNSAVFAIRTLSEKEPVKLSASEGVTVHVHKSETLCLDSLENQLLNDSTIEVAVDRVLERILNGEAKCKIVDEH